MKECLSPSDKRITFFVFFFLKKRKSYNTKPKLTCKGIPCNKWLEVVYQKIGEIFI